MFLDHVKSSLDLWGEYQPSPIDRSILLKSNLFWISKCEGESSQYHSKYCDGTSILLFTIREELKGQRRF